MDNHQLDFLNYSLPFSWRYGSKKMRGIFSEKKQIPSLAKTLAYFSENSISGKAYR